MHLIIFKFQNIKNFIDGAKHGAILFTFGSITKSNLISPEMRTLLRDAFAQIPERVIWKFEEKIEGLSNNVMLVDWVPQRDILGKYVVPKTLQKFIHF